MDNTLTIRIPENIRNDLKELSVLKNIPISELVRESIKKYTTIQHVRRLRNKVLAFTKAQGLLTDEDISKALS